MEIKNKIIVNDFPLISVIIITYNSERYIIETLESILLQKYPNIELIISDDASCDSTIKICSEWIKYHHASFIRIKLLTVENNTGISSNCNRGLLESQGAWIKLLAGDDLLESECLNNNFNYVKRNIEKNVKFIFSQQQRFNNVFCKKNYSDIVPIPDEHPIYSDESTAFEQYNSLLKFEKYLPGPTTFYHKSLIEKFGGYNEKYPMLEDFPFYLKILENNIKIHFMNKVTVYYRIHSQSVLRVESSTKLVTSLDINWNNFALNYVLPRVSFIRQLNIIWHYCFAKIIFSIGNTGWFAEFLRKIEMKFRPIKLFWFRRKISKYTVN